MAPKPDDDLFIEPASDDDVVYGDYNSTMDGASSSGQRPYIRLTSQLRNATRDAGGEVRFRCEAIGTPPLTFTWLKNHAPLDKGRRVRVRNKESSSRLVISELDVLDSGYYQCIASNSAASVNTTSVLRVNNVADSALKHRKSKTSSHISNDYEDYELMDRGRLPDEEEADLFRVPDSAGGRGFVPESGGNERWLDGIKYRVGDCLPYRGEACRAYLSGRHVMMTSESREDMYDIDRNLRAAMLFINSSPSISQQCRQISQSVACYHMYKVCDGATNSKQPITICKKDCDRITSEVCPSELSLAAQHELVGDGPKALFPSCPSLPSINNNCIPVLEVPQMPQPEMPRGQLVHWCYVNTGTKYEGSISTTTSGKACIDWKHSTSREFNVHRYPGLENSKNFCRNPGGKKTKPWCYAQPMGQEEYCDVPQCPKEMYPHLKESTDTNDSSFSLTNTWDSLSSQWQLMAVGGGVCLLFLILFLLCCLCCCRSKNKSKGRSSTASRPAHSNNHVSGPPSLINSAANSAYYRKLAGTSTPILSRGGNPLEMASLLPDRNPPGYHERAPPPAPYLEPFHILEIPHSQLQVSALIGEGQFGLVHSGTWTRGMSQEEDHLQVAIKTVRPDATNAEKASLEEEVRSVAPFNHPHVVKLLGVCYLDGGRLSAIFEYMVHGDLHDFLRLRAPQATSDAGTVTDHEDFMKIAMQISSGMEYLSSMSYVHRDLATRNCLVGDQRVIKVADFGLMRACYDNDYYKMLHRSWMPVRWMSKEALEHGRFSESSDVWAYGVTLWEIWSYGRQPYEGFTNQQVIELIASHNLLECPPGCPSNIYSLMVECWNSRADCRLSFSQIHQKLEGWLMASPAHSLLQQQRGSAAGSSQSGSSLSNRGPSKPLSSRPAPYSSRSIGRRQDDVPLVRRDANYAYSEDGDSD